MLGEKVTETCTLVSKQNIYLILNYQCDGKHLEDLKHLYLKSSAHVFSLHCRDHYSNSEFPTIPALKILHSSSELLSSLPLSQK